MNIKLKIQEITEHQIQASIVDFCTAKQISQYLIHIPNQQVIFGLFQSLKGSLSHRHQMNWQKKMWGYWNRLKALGFRKGTSDLFLALPRGDFHGRWMEVKRKGKIPTAEQIEFLDLMESIGYSTHWFDNVDDGISGLQNYLSM